MNIFTLLEINDITRNNIWPAILKQLTKKFKSTYFQISPNISRNKIEPVIGSMVDLFGINTLIILRLVCKKFKTIFTDDFYWEKVYKYNPSPFYITNHFTGEIYLPKEIGISEKFDYYLGIIVDIPDGIEKKFFDEIKLYKCSRKRKKFLEPGERWILQKRHKYTVM